MLPPLSPLKLLASRLCPAPWLPVPLLGLGLLLTLPGAGHPRLHDVPVAVVVHPSCPVTDISLADLRQRMLLLRRHWPDGHRVVVLMRPTGTPEQEVFLHKVARMDERALRRHWISLLNSGRISHIPSTVRTPATVATILQQVRGAIALLPAADVPAGLRVLAVEGRRPGEEGYSLLWHESEATP